MQKKQAIELLGGTTSKAAEAIGITSPAITQWPDELPPRLADRVLAACLRMGRKVPKELLQAAPTKEAA